MPRFLRVALVVLAASAFLFGLAPGAPPASAESRVLVVGSDISYVPFEFYRPGTKTVVGFDYDLAQAIGKRMGARVEFRNGDFATLIPQLRAGKADLVMSSLSDTREREKQVDFIDYFLSGSGILTKAGNPAHLWDLASLCGHTVSVERGTSQEAAVRKQRARCKELGLGDITLIDPPTDEAAFAAFRAGRSDAHISDYSVVAYTARTRGGGLAVVGRQFGIVPFGIAVAKSNAALRGQVQRALLAVVHDGTYDGLLKKWGLEQGALRSAPIDAGTTFQR